MTRLRSAANSWRSGGGGIWNEPHGSENPGFVQRRNLGAAEIPRHRLLLVRQGRPQPFIEDLQVQFRKCVVSEHPAKSIGQSRFEIGADAIRPQRGKTCQRHECRLPIAAEVLPGNLTSGVNELGLKIAPSELAQCWTYRRKGRQALHGSRLHNCGNRGDSRPIP
jgi:hypothetical protein